MCQSPCGLNELYNWGHGLDHYIRLAFLWYLGLLWETSDLGHSTLGHSTVFGSTFYNSYLLVVLNYQSRVCGPRDVACGGHLQRKLEVDGQTEKPGRTQSRTPTSSLNNNNIFAVSGDCIKCI